jgi:signal transduction histidine kinase
MTLRSKMLLVTSMVCAALLVLAALLIWQMSLASYSQLERQSIERDLTLAKTALQNSLTQLETNTFGYSYWDDTQAFVRGEQPEYLAENDLINNPPPATGIDVLVLSDLQGEVAFARVYDLPDHGKEVESEVLGPLDRYLSRREDDATVFSGALLVAGQPALVVIAPLLNSAGQLPATGTMISVNYLHQEYLAELSKTIGSPLVLHTLNEIAPEAVQAARTLWQTDPTQLVISSLSNLIQGYFLVPDIVGRPLLAFGVETQPTIYQQGLKNVLILVATLFAVGVVAVLTVGVLLERVLLSRLSALSKSVRKISEMGDVTARVTLSGQDELAGLSQDINQMLSSLEHQGEALRKSNQELEQFAYVASHDLQEPLRKVQAFSDRLATKYATQLDDDGRLYISRMQDATTRMRNLIQDLLSYSRIRSKGQEFVLVDLNETVRGVVSDLEVRLEQSGGRVKLGDLPTVLADPMQMRQVFQNLIGNALKFKREGVAPVVKIAAKEAGSSYLIVVQDNGIGFEQQYAERVFEIFQRLHGRGEYEGTGIGLAIVKKILERHVGGIRAESEVGEGTRFILTLPKHQDTPFKRTLVESTPVGAKTPSGKERLKELV